MKRFLSFLFICSAMILQARDFKVNHKDEIRPFEFKIEKIKVENNEAIVFIKIKQRQNFSYSISFADCYLTTPSNPDGIKGKLTTWNNDKKIYRDSQTISDSEYEKLTLTFPTDDVTYSQSFDIKIGEILDRDKTEIIFRNLATKKK